MTLLSRLRGLPWRRWNTALHRDVGYLAAGLTLVYAFSGLAVNHMADWNPNYRRVDRVLHVAPVPTDLAEEATLAAALERLGEKGRPKSSFQPDAETLQIFFQDRSYTLDLPSGKAVLQGVRPRPGLYAMNRLHLNAPKGAWTYVADLYAACLAFLALSGLFILKGRLGLAGRGAWLTAAGVLLPVAYWTWWQYFA